MSNINAIMHPRTEMARVIFNIVITEAVRCMEMCLKYNRAQAPPSSSDKAAFKELITWTWNTTRDPDTLANYEDTLSASFWLSYRCGMPWQELLAKKVFKSLGDDSAG